MTKTISQLSLLSAEDVKPTPSPPQPSSRSSYDAADIEVLEGLEPVRRRPGMFIGGTDETALHHLFAEVLDNSMDEVIGGHANLIEVSMTADGFVRVTDNGRGIPTDPHPRFPDKSAIEVILCTLHAGGKFGSGAYEASGGLHGVGISVVNALSRELRVEVARGRKRYSQSFSRGEPMGPLQLLGSAPNQRGTTIHFTPDPQIFGENTKFRPARIYAMARAKAYLFGGVRIRWKCDESLLTPGSSIAPQSEFHFANGLHSYLEENVKGNHPIAEQAFVNSTGKPGRHGSLEWAVTWLADRDGEFRSFCNTIPTPHGGTHEAAFRVALVKSLRNFGEAANLRKASTIVADDVMSSMVGVLSVFIREPEFQGQTKEKLSSAEATRIVESTVRARFDHWLAEHSQQGNAILQWVCERADERIRRKREKEISRKTATRKLRLPGKLADCARKGAQGTEIFVVEGDSAGGSAKQARDRDTQAILPLRGKILNVVSAGRGKRQQNQQLSDLILALGCGTGSGFRTEDLRYERVVIMTDADVDGAHIASLLISFFFQELRELIREGHLFLAVPPLYRLSCKRKTIYARDDAHREQLLKEHFKRSDKVEISRFKGLGEMMPAQLKSTTMDPKHRTLLKVHLDPDGLDRTEDSVRRLMGVQAEPRFKFIQEKAAFATDLDV